MAWKNVQYENGKMRTSSGGGGGSTVTITPTLSSGTKIADFEIDGNSGELYAPQGGGGNELANLDDVNISNPGNGDILVYRNSNSKWENESGLPYVPEIYSTEEREIGVWTDEKPLYQKTYHIEPTSTSILISISSLNIDKVGDLKGIWRRTGNNRDYPLFPRTESNSYPNHGIQMWIDYDTDKLQIIIDGYSVSSVAYMDVTIQYTKTTDAPGSGKWTTDGTPTHHYSTTEQVVGTWIDGSTIYEKTIECDITISNTNWNNTNIILEHDKVISCLLNDGSQCWNATSGKYGSGATATIGLRLPTVDSGGTRIRQIVLQYTKPTS